MATSRLGTPYFVSPEIVNGDEYDYSSDIFSLGSTMFYYATKKYLFDGRSPKQLFKSISHHKTPKLK